MAKLSQIFIYFFVMSSSLSLSGSEKKVKRRVKAPTVVIGDRKYYPCLRCNQVFFTQQSERLAHNYIHAGQNLQTNKKPLSCDQILDLLEQNAERVVDATAALAALSEKYLSLFGSK